jgi:DNA-binding NarL/FixJ family response regulator
MSHKITAMLVDDHAVVRAGYKLLLEQAGHIEVVLEAERGEEACQFYHEHRPQVVVMDLNLPGIGGLSAVRRIVARDHNAKILMFSIHDELAYVARALEAGARGYITKSCAPDVLVEAVQRVAVNETYLEPEIAQKLAVQNALRQERPGDLNRLSAREFDIFCLLARGYTTREAANELFLGHKTVSNYATLIKDKLHVNSTADLVRLAYRYGLIKS